MIQSILDSTWKQRTESGLNIDLVFFIYQNQALRIISFLSRLYSTSSLWCIIIKALLTCITINGNNVTHKKPILKKKKRYGIFFIKIGTYNGLVQPHSRELVDQPPLWYVVPNSDSSLDLSLGLLLYKRKIYYVGTKVAEIMVKILLRLGQSNVRTFTSFAISGVRLICWLIPDLAASIVETVKSLRASFTFSSVATWDLKSQLIIQKED